MPRPASWIPIALAVATGSVLITTFLVLNNTRTLVSWHGFLHTAIANRFPGPFRAPENPFFAGEPLPYYWFHHDVASLIGRTFQIHPIVVFQIITASGLVVLWMSAAAIGVYRFRSLKAGLLAGFLLLAGVNPLGPAIAVAKRVVLGTQLITPRPPPDALETVFVSDRESDQLMTQPLLGALYVSGDWRRGQNVPWYLDISSRSIGLALIAPLLLIFLRGSFSWMGALTLAITAAAITAFNPLIGLAVVGALSGGSVVVILLNRLRPGSTGSEPLAIVGFAAAAVLGAAAAGPTFYHLFLVGGSAAAVEPLSTILVKGMALVFNVIVLLPLALWSCLRRTNPYRDQCRALVLGACALLLVVPLISLPDDTEHNLANTAQYLLVIPAVALLVERRVRGLTNVVMVSLFLPTAVASLASYLGRPSLPVEFDGSVIHRTTDHPLERLYGWIRTSTARDSAFIADPATPVKVSGNVAELPAFTARTMFVDHASYLTTPHRDFELRRDVAERLANGGAMSDQDALYLAALRRPIFLLTYHADRSDQRIRLFERYGSPAFEDGFVAAFDLTTRLHDVKK